MSGWRCCSAQSASGRPRCCWESGCYKTEIHRRGTAAAASAQQAHGRRADPVHVGQVLELTCDRLALEGKPLLTPFLTPSVVHLPGFYFKSKDLPEPPCVALLLFNPLQGICLAPPSNFVVMCDRALPGERLLAEIAIVRKGFAEARKVRSLSPHTAAVAPRCPHFGPCGGCSLQSLQYSAQLEEKQNQVFQTLKRVGKVKGLQQALLPIVPCTQTYGYRNKTQLTFSARSWDQTCAEEGQIVEDRPALGLLLRGSHDVVVPVGACHLQDDISNQLLQLVGQAVQQAGLLPHNHSSGQGLLKHLIIRSGTGLEVAQLSGSTANVDNSTRSSGKQYLLALVTTRNRPELLQPIVEAVAQQLPSGYQAKGASNPSERINHSNSRQPTSPRKSATIPSSDQSHDRSSNSNNGSSSSSSSSSKDKNHNAPRHSETGSISATWPLASAAHVADSQQAEATHLLYGRPHLVDSLCGLSFEVSEGSFFQTNTDQAQVLYNMVRDGAGLRADKSDVLLDLYCGTGTIGLTLARDCKQVLGVDVNGNAIEDARNNAARNGIANASFICGDAGSLAAAWTASSSSSSSSKAHGNGSSGKPTSNSSNKTTSNHVKVTLASGRLRSNNSGSNTSSIKATAALATNSTAAATAATDSFLAAAKPDVVVVDPARSGLSRSMVDFLGGCGARRVVYVSCNPATQARDLALLCGQEQQQQEGQQQQREEGQSCWQEQPVGKQQQQRRQSKAKFRQQAAGALEPRFRLLSVQPCDMFPHTDHVEAVAVLDRLW